MQDELYGGARRMDPEASAAKEKAERAERDSRNKLERTMQNSLTSTWNLGVKKQPGIVTRCSK